MNVTNSLQTKIETKKPTLSDFLNKPETIKSLSPNFANDKDRLKFVASVISAYTTNPALQGCTYSSVTSTALTAHALNLSLAPQLGFCYAVPFDQKEKRDREGNVIQKACKTAVFQMGYRGYLQLAIRSGFYEDIDVIEVREGEYLGRDTMTGKHRFAFIADEDVRESRPIVGYLAYFTQINGFKKQIYWTRDKMLKHADRYSQAFSLYGNEKKVSYEDFLAGKYPKSDAWKYSSFWYTSFDDMAFKTMIKQLISKWGIMSLEMQTAFEKDEEENSPANNTIDGFVDEDGEIIKPDANNSRLNAVLQGTDEPPVITETATKSDETSEVEYIDEDDVQGSFFA